MLMATTGIYAQTGSTVTLRGTVKDSLSGAAEPYATIRVLKDGTDKAQKVTTTDTDGHFSITLPRQERYTVECIVIGKAVLRREVQADGRTSVSMDDFLLQDISNSLGTATVTAQRPLVKAEIDKVTYSMADDPEAQTNSLLEMLRKVPMVTVDGEDEIKVKGSTGFKVYVNGKPNQMMSSNPSLIFKNYPASAIKKIEVITDPGAKYDAEGVSGILNIITNDGTTTKGYSLTPDIRWTNRGIGGGLFGMVQVGKLTLSTQYAVGHNENPSSTSTTEREIFDDPDNHLFRSEGRTMDNSGTYQFGNLEASYEFNEHNLLTVTGGIHSYKGKAGTFSTNEMQRLDGSRLYAYERRGSSHFKYPSYNFGTDYQHTFSTEGRMLTLSYRLQSSPTHSSGDSYYTFRPDEAPVFTLNDLSTDSRATSTEHTGQVDFTTPFGEHHELSVGAKYIHRNNHSESTEMLRPAGTDDDFMVNPDNSLRYRHRTDIAAAYAEYQLKYGDLVARAGTRYEYSHVHANYPDGSRPGYSSDFSDVVPTISLGYKLTEMQMFKLSYNMRIGRPDIDMLSPYVDRSLPTEISYGNPNLESEHRHNFSLDYSSFSTKFSINSSLSYGVSNNGLTGYSFVQDGVMNTTYDNIEHSKTLDLSLFLNLTMVKNLSISINANGGYSDYKCYRTGDHTYGWSGGLSGGLNYQMPWKVKVGFWGGYWSRSIGLQGRSTGWKFYSFNLSRSFLKEDRLTASFFCGNFIHPKIRYRNETVTDTFRSISTSWYNQMRIGVGLRFRLGKLQTVVKRAQRSIQNDDVVGGSSGNGGGQGGQGGGAQ